MINKLTLMIMVLLVGCSLSSPPEKTPSLPEKTEETKAKDLSSRVKLEARIQCVYIDGSYNRLCEVDKKELCIIGRDGYSTCGIGKD